MVSTLEEARRMQEQGYPVNIRREVRYFADVGNTQYILAHDWTLEELEKRLWREPKYHPKKTLTTNNSKLMKKSNNGGKDY